mgnify:FL=1
MSYTNRRVPNPVDCRICLPLLGFFTSPLVLLISVGGCRALTSRPTLDRRISEQMNRSCSDKGVRA